MLVLQSIVGVLATMEALLLSIFDSSIAPTFAIYLTYGAISSSTFTNAVSNVNSGFAFAIDLAASKVAPVLNIAENSVATTFNFDIADLLEIIRSAGRRDSHISMIDLLGTDFSGLERILFPHWTNLSVSPMLGVDGERLVLEGFSQDVWCAGMQNDAELTTVILESANLHPSLCRKVHKPSVPTFAENLPAKPSAFAHLSTLAFKSHSSFDVTEDIYTQTLHSNTDEATVGLSLVKRFALELFQRRVSAARANPQQILPEVMALGLFIMLVASLMSSEGIHELSSPVSAFFEGSLHGEPLDPAPDEAENSEPQDATPADTKASDEESVTPPLSDEDQSSVIDPPEEPLDASGAQAASDLCENAEDDEPVDASQEVSVIAIVTPLFTDPQPHGQIDVKLSKVDHTTTFDVDSPLLPESGSAPSADVERAEQVKDVEQCDTGDLSEAGCAPSSDDVERAAHGELLDGVDTAEPGCAPSIYDVKGAEQAKVKEQAENVDAVEDVYVPSLDDVEHIEQSPATSLVQSIFEAQSAGIPGSAPPTGVERAREHIEAEEPSGIDQPAGTSQVPLSLDAENDVQLAQEDFTAPALETQVANLEDSTPPSASGALAPLNAEYADQPGEDIVQGNDSLSSTSERANDAGSSNYSGNATERNARLTDDRLGGDGDEDSPKKNRRGNRGKGTRHRAGQNTGPRSERRPPPFRIDQSVIHQSLGRQIPSRRS